MKCWEKINKLIAPLSSPSGCVSPEAPALNSLRDYNVQSDSKPWKGTMQKDPCQHTVAVIVQLLEMMSNGVTCIFFPSLLLVNCKL